MEITLTFPDGREAQYPHGTTGMQVAQGISRKLAEVALALRFNGEVHDLNRPITENGSIAILTWEDEDGKSTFWHSSAHLLAEALEVLYPGVKLAIGPAVKEGFYYDVDLGDRKLSEEDFPAIEEKMKELAKANSTFSRTEVSKDDALAYFTKKADPYKLELINELQDGSITFYNQGNFTDLCRGPHLPGTGVIKAIKVTHLAGAYWRGKEENPMLTRIYGVTFPKANLLEEYAARLEEQKRRDHRTIGKAMELFTFDDDVGPGLPLWLPNGAVMIEELEALAKQTESRAGYHRVRTPHLAKESMYLTSGHLPYYEDGMFPSMDLEGVKYYLKAMNCPHHHKIFDALPRTYKDLPLRLAEYGTCYRYEKSGELFGLMRVRHLQMNDAHIYCTEEQFEAEFKAVNELYLNYFKIFGIDKYIMRFSTHSKERLGKKYIDEPELWLKTEDMVRKVLISSGIPYIEVPDEAAFYGPKIDVQVYSAIGREFTLATNQVDFAQPRRFNLTYKTADNGEATPLCIHRAPLGTHERFIGFLIEHYAGEFPFWLSPVQVAVMTLSERFEDYGKEVAQTLREADIRVYFDDRSEKVGKKIRDAEIRKIPYMLVVGEKEAESRTVAVRKHKEGDQGAMPLDQLLGHLQKLAKERIARNFDMR